MPRDSYPESFVQHILDGKARPKNGRVLLRAVTRSEVRKTSIIVPDSAMPTEQRQAPYHEIVAVADDVDDPDIRVGALCQFVSAAADFSGGKEYVFVKAAHIIACEAA